MTQKADILRMLQDAGDKGVSGRTFYQTFKGRGVARIWDLKQEGYVIEDERDPVDPKYKRYRLNVGSNAGGGIELRGGEVDDTLDVASGAETDVPSHSGSRPAPSNGYEAWEG